MIELMATPPLYGTIDSNRNDLEGEFDTQQPQMYGIEKSCDNRDGIHRNLVMVNGHSNKSELLLCHQP